MNNHRRRQLDTIIAALEGQRVALESLKVVFSDIAERIESVRDDEQEAFDNMPTGAQNGERGADMQFAIEQLEEAISAALEVGDLEADVDEIIRSLDEAKGPPA